MLMVVAIVASMAAVIGLIMLAVYLRAKMSAIRATSNNNAIRPVGRYRKIAALSLDQARDEAMRLLPMPHRFVCTETAASDADNLDILAPELRALFSRYERILAVGTESVVDRRLIAPFGWDFHGPWREHQTWQIGTSHEHGLVLVKPNSEGIYDINGMDADDDLTEPTDASIFYWLILAAQSGDYGIT